MKIEIIPHRYCVEPNGKRSSLYGAAPHGPCEVVTHGYTWRLTDHTGRTTIGLGRKPAATYEEALDVAEHACDALGWELVSSVEKVI